MRHFLHIKCHLHFISSEITPSAHKTQVEFRSLFREKKVRLMGREMRYSSNCCIMYGEYTATVRTNSNWASRGNRITEKHSRLTRRTSRCLLSNSGARNHEFVVPYKTKPPQRRNKSVKYRTFRVVEHKYTSDFIRNLYWKTYTVLKFKDFSQ
jgi:hypothetical protein